MDGFDLNRFNSRMLPRYKERLEESKSMLFALQAVLLDDLVITLLLDFSTFTAHYLNSLFEKYFIVYSLGNMKAYL